MMSDARGIIRKVIQLFAGPLGWRSSPVKVTLSIAPSPLAGSHLITAICSPESQVTRVEFYIDSVLKTPADTSPPFTYLFNTTTVGDGPHWVEAVAYFDRNKKASAKQQVTVQNVPAPPPPPPPPQDVPVNVTGSPPTISDTTPTQGQTLTATTGAWTNSPDRYTYQWLRGTSKAPIPSATGSSYTCGLTDVNEVLRVAVTAWNIAGPSAAAESAATTAVAGTASAVPVLVSSPLISGTPVQGNSLSVSNGQWSNSPTDYDYQWERCSISPAAVPILDAFNRVNAGPPPSASWTDMTGMAGLIVSGSQLASNGSGWLGAYWNGANFGPDCVIYADIAAKPTTQNYLELHLKMVNPGATTGDGYILEIAGHSNNTRIYERASGVNTLLITHTATVWATGDGIGLSAQGDVLTVWRRAGASGSWSAVFSHTDSTYQSQSGRLGVVINGTTWRLDNVGGGSITCGDISGAIGSSYTLTSSDVGSAIRAEVTANNASGSSTPADSALTAAVTSSAPPPPPAPNAYWDENFESGQSPPPGWNLEKARWPGGTGYTGVSDTYVADPWGGGNGQVVRFRCTADFNLPMSYDAGQRQLVSYYRQISNSYSGMNNGQNRETWYRTKFGFPAGTHFSQGMWHFLQEWHHDGNTWSGGGSPGMNIYGDYPLVNGQPAANPRLAVVWRHGSSTDPYPSQYPAESYWPNTAQGQMSSWQPISLTYDHWYDSVFRVIWSTNASQGLVQWWLDGVLRINRIMQTSVFNPNLPYGHAQNFFGLYNYRYNINVDSDVYFARSIAGPSAASVGFTVP